MDELHALTAWGQRGYQVSLHYGPTYRENTLRVEWNCTIHVLSLGSVFVPLPTAQGYDPSDASAAVREALAQAELLFGGGAL